MAAALIWVVAAAADAPDVNDVGNKASPPIPAASANVDRCFNGTTPTGACPGLAYSAANANALKVTVQGSWLWTTHGSSCTDDRAGVGYAISWSDARQGGNLVKTNVPTGVGNATTTVSVGVAIGDTLNPFDNTAHPTRNSATGTFSGVVDSQSTAWRGGCGNAPDANGKYPGQTGYTGPPLNTKGVGAGTANGTDQSKLPRGLWGPISHIYQRAADIGTICAITYDVHKGTAPDSNGGVGIPGSVKEVTAGGTSRNPDNGAEKNSGTPLGNACPPIHIPNPVIRVEKLPAQQTVNTGGTATWTIRVTNMGDEDLSNITISDTQAALCAGALTSLAPTSNATGWNATTGTLAVSGTVSYTCTFGPVTGPFTNVVTACGFGTSGVQTCDDDTTDVSQQGKVGIEDILTNQDVVPNDRAKMAVDDAATAAIEGAIDPQGNFSYELFKYDGSGTDPCGTDGTSILGPLTPTASTGGTPAFRSSATSNSLKLSQLPVGNPAGDADSAGTYYWKVSYPGDVVAGLTINAAFSECNEYLTINNG